MSSTFIPFVFEHREFFAPAAACGSPYNAIQLPDGRFVQVMATMVDPWPPQIIDVQEIFPDESQPIFEAFVPS